MKYWQFVVAFVFCASGCTGWESSLPYSQKEGKALEERVATVEPLLQALHDNSEAATEANEGMNDRIKGLRTDLTAVNDALGKRHDGKFATLMYKEKTWEQAMNESFGEIDKLKKPEASISVTSASVTGKSPVGIVVPPPDGSVIPPPGPAMPPPPPHFEIVAQKPHCYIVRCKRRKIFIQCDAYNGTILYRQWVPRPGCVCATPHGDWVPVTAPW